MTGTVRILLLADSHLGFDLPLRPRVERRRRGHDFLANHVAALEEAAGQVDMVVHAGDVFHRPRVVPSLAYQAYEPLVRVADLGIPVYIVPGNHERSRLPHRRFLEHPRVHVFDGPRTFVTEVGGVRVAMSGFPYARRVRRAFPALLERTGWSRVPADLRFLCLHHCVEGATVGPGDHTFDRAPDVIRGRDVPAGFAALLSGHIHRHQVLAADLRGRPLAAPVLYPGSVERTSTAEAGEPKGFLVVYARPMTKTDSRPASPTDLPPLQGGASGRLSWEFRRLPARPMVVKDLAADGLSDGKLEAAVRAIIDVAPPDAVLRIRVVGRPHGATGGLPAARLRRLAPPSMNVEVRLADGWPTAAMRGRRARRDAGQGGRGSGRGSDRGSDRGSADLQLDFGST
jgi:DNA repair protein SbcD/Mre11